MSFYAVLLIAFGLCVDSFAVAASCGMSTKTHLWKQAMRVAVCFTMFHAGMTLIGWEIGTELRQFIREVDHWIAFALLTIIGLKMIVEAWGGCRKEQSLNIISLRRLCAMAMATSIDALAVGAGFAFLPVHILQVTLVIGVVTLFATSMGVLIGRFVGCLFEEVIAILGGVALIGIGLKILLEHLLRAT